MLNAARIDVGAGAAEDALDVATTDDELETTVGAGGTGVAVGAGAHDAILRAKIATRARMMIRFTDFLRGKLFYARNDFAALAEIIPGETVCRLTKFFAV